MNEFDLIEHIAKLTRIVRRRPNIKVSRSGFAMLKTVTETDGIRTSELAEMLDIRPSSLSEGLDKLEADGYVERRKNEEDMRIVHVHATEKTRKDFERIELENKEYYGKLSSCLTEEEAQAFCDTCDKLYDFVNREYGQEQEHRHHCHCGKGGKQ